MSTVNSVTFTALTPDQGVIAVVDTANGNAILTGTLANLSAVESDPTQDTASIDSTAPNTLDVTPITNTGATMVTVKGDFTSTGNAGITDGTVFPGITVQVAVTNNIPTTPPPPPPLFRDCRLPSRNRIHSTFKRKRSPFTGAFFIGMGIAAH